MHIGDTAPSASRKLAAMPTLPAVDLTELLKGIPSGAWVAISRRQDRVVAYGADIREVLQEARNKGESNPLITRVSESTTTALIL